VPAAPRRSGCDPTANLAAGQLLAGACRVSLVEYQVHDAQDAPQPPGKLVVGRHLVPDARVGDLALGAGDPLTHRRLADRERTGEFDANQGSCRDDYLTAMITEGKMHDGEQRIAAGEPLLDDG
jgi:hypothetical protein